MKRWKGVKLKLWHNLLLALLIGAAACERVGVTDVAPTQTPGAGVVRPTQTPGAVAGEPEPTPAAAGEKPQAVQLLERQRLVYGSEIGGWSYDGRYDAHPLLTSEVCRDLSREANIEVYRWLPWSRFEDMGGNMPDEQFDGVIDGIIAAGAEPLVKLPPGAPRHFRDEPFVDMEWLKEIISRAGPRVQLYEFANEANYYGDWTADDYTEHWLEVVPELKRHARELGFEIYVGGPVWSGPNLKDLSDFMKGVQEVYEESEDEDVLPAFISWHTYLSSGDDTSNREIHDKVPNVGSFIEAVRAETENVFGRELPTAITEWNYTSEDDDRHESDPDFVWDVTDDMLDQFREHGLWLSIQFAFSSDPGSGALDMVSGDCEPKAMYEAFKAHSTSEGG